MSKKLIACGAAFALAVAALLAGTALAARTGSKAGGCCFPGSECCYPGSECCYPGSPCCGDNCCFPGSPCCFPGSPCCGDCCVEGAACCSKGAACCTATFTAAVTDEADAPAEVATVIAVEDMDCPSCAKKVIAKLNEVAGVGTVVADTKESKLTVTPKGKAAPSAKAMWEAVEKAGYKPTRLEGPAGKFTASPKE